MAEQKTSAFDDWLFRNGIHIPPTLKEKLETKYIASAEVLSQIKKIGDDSMTQVITELKLNIYEKAVFNVILSKLDGETGGLQSHDHIMTIVPQIIDISDNKNGTVNIKWKLSQKPLYKDSENRLKLEWAEDEKALQFDNTNDQIIRMNKIDLESVHETKNVLVPNLTASIFRLKWRNFSNTKAIKIETDLWDTNNKGELIQILNDNIIKHTAASKWSSVYGKVVCKTGYKYHWQFKIKTFAIHFMFGVAKVSNGFACKDTYLGTKEVGYYAAYGNANTAYVYQSGASGEYGMKRFNKNGCVLDMYLDLTNYKLSFKTGGQDTGVVIDNLSQEDYRMIVSLYNGQQIELVAFDYN
eukprot:124641_1